MAYLKTVRVNAETGEVEYLYPLEITPENRVYLRETARLRHLETGMVLVGNRKFNAVLIPVTKGQYHDLISDDKKTQDQERCSNRCTIADGHGGTKLCPRQIPNPNYVEGGKEPKMIENRCEDCPRFQSYGLAVGRTVLFSELTAIDESGEEVEFEPFAPDNYYSADRYEELSQEFVDFVRARKPKYVSLAEKLTEEHSQAESSKKLDTASSTINDWDKVLQELVVEFLQDFDSMY